MSSTNVMLEAQIIEPVTPGCGDQLDPATWGRFRWRLHRTEPSRPVTGWTGWAPFRLICEDEPLGSLTGEPMWQASLERWGLPSATAVQFNPNTHVPGHTHMVGVLTSDQDVPDTMAADEDPNLLDPSIRAARVLSPGMVTRCELVHLDDGRWALKRFNERSNWLAFAEPMMTENDRWAAQAAAMRQLAAEGLRATWRDWTPYDWQPGKPDEQEAEGGAPEALWLNVRSVVDDIDTVCVENRGTPGAPRWELHMFSNTQPTGKRPAAYPPSPIDDRYPVAGRWLGEQGQSFAPFDDAADLLTDTLGLDFDEHTEWTNTDPTHWQRPVCAMIR